MSKARLITPSTFTNYSRGADNSCEQVPKATDGYKCAERGNCLAVAEDRSEEETRGQFLRSPNCLFGDRREVCDIGKPIENKDNSERDRRKFLQCLYWILEYGCNYEHRRKVVAVIKDLL